MACLWLIYLVEALVDHNQFTSVTHIIVIGSLLGLPAALAGAPPAMSPVTPTVAPPGQVGRR